MATTTNDIDSLFNDSDDDDLVENTICDKVTKESFLALVEAASNGGDFIKIINLLPNSSQRSDRLTNTTEKAMVRLFSPSPTFTDVSSSVNETASYVAAKEVKVVVERKLLCLKEQIEYQKYVLMSECFNAEEKVAAKQELAALMKELKELTK